MTTHFSGAKRVRERASVLYHTDNFHAYLHFDPTFLLCTL